jgi:predicted oxidoreductase
MGTTRRWEGGITRRRALTVTGGMIAGAALAAQAFPAFGAESQDADAIVVGHGLAGLVATAELAAAGRKVLLLDQEPEASLGGQAFWSFGGLFFVDSDEQRLMGVKDSRDLAWQDWLGSAGFDRGVGDPSGQDHWAYKWAEA